jgi:serine/threonine protein phosphatase 1
MSRIIAIGDIHGFKNVLTEILVKISKKYDFKTNKLVFLGDYVDRGNDDFGTLDFLIQLEIDYPHFIFLLGNHDDEWLASGHPEGIIIPKKYLDFFKRCKIYHKEKSFSLTHGGIPEKYTLISEVPKDQLLWSRETWFKYNEAKLVVGHSIKKEVLDMGNCIYVDTGVCRSDYGKLSAVVLDDERGEMVEVIQVINKFNNV